MLFGRWAHRERELGPSMKVWRVDANHQLEEVAASRLRTGRVAACVVWAWAHRERERGQVDEGVEGRCKSSTPRGRRSSMRTGLGECLCCLGDEHRERERGPSMKVWRSMQIINSKRRRSRMRTELGEVLVLFGRWAHREREQRRVDEGGGRANHQLEEAAAKQAAHGSGVSCLCCLGDGRIVSGSNDGSMKVWRVDANHQLEEAATKQDAHGDVVVLVLFGRWAHRAGARTGR